MSRNARRADPEQIKEALDILYACAATKELKSIITLNFRIPEQRQWIETSETLSMVDIFKMFRKVDPEDNLVAYSLLWTVMCVRGEHLTNNDWKEIDDIVDRYNGPHRQALVNAYLRLIWEEASTKVRLSKWLVDKYTTNPLEGDISHPDKLDEEGLRTSKQILEQYIKSSIVPDNGDEYSDSQKQWILDNGSVADLRALIKSLKVSDVKWFAKLAEYYDTCCKGRPGGYITIEVHDYAASRRASLGISSKEVRTHVDKWNYIPVDEMDTEEADEYLNSPASKHIDAMLRESAI